MTLHHHTDGICSVVERAPVLYEPYDFSVKYALGSAEVRAWRYLLRTLELRENLEPDRVFDLYINDREEKDNKEAVICHFRWNDVKDNPIKVMYPGEIGREMFAFDLHRISHSLAYEYGEKYFPLIGGGVMQEKKIRDNYV